MIALHDNLPVIEMPDGQVVAFEREWLVRSLTLAAQRAGYAKWWLAEHVAASIAAYLRDQRTINVLPMGRLTSAVQSVLQVIGYGEVGRHFAPAPLKVRISLVDLAREAGSGYELAFFGTLRRSIEELVQSRSSHFELTGLEACVKLLRARKSWSRDCDALRTEIVIYARAQTATCALDREILFSLT